MKKLVCLWILVLVLVFFSVFSAPTLAFAKNYKKKEPRGEVLERIAIGAVIGALASDRASRKSAALAGAVLGGLSGVYNARDRAQAQSQKIRQNPHNRRIEPASAPAHAPTGPVVHIRRIDMPGYWYGYVEREDVRPVLESGLAHLGYRVLDPEAYNETPSRAELIVDLSVSVSSVEEGSRNNVYDSGGFFGNIFAAESRIVGGGTYRIAITTTDAVTGLRVPTKSAIEEITIVVYRARGQIWQIVRYRGEQYRAEAVLEPPYEAAVRALEFIFGMHNMYN